MPTYDALASFLEDFTGLTREQQRAFLAALPKFIDDARAGRFRESLRVKGVRGVQGVFEMTWARDGRATFHYGRPIVPDEVHIVWRRIRAHDILRAP